MTTSTATSTQHDEDQLLGVTEAAALMGRSTFWIIEHSSGKVKPRLPFVRFGRKIQFQLQDANLQG